MIHLSQILITTTILFFTGIIGLVLNRKNVLITIMSIELMLLSVNLNFLAFSVHLDDIVGQIFVLFILTIAATESAIGLAILTVYNNTRNNINIEILKNIMKNYFFVCACFILMCSIKFKKVINITKVMRFELIYSARQAKTFTKLRYTFGFWNIFM